MDRLLISIMSVKRDKEGFLEYQRAITRDLLLQFIAMNNGQVIVVG